MGISTYVFSQTGGIFIANHEHYSIIYINNITHIYVHVTYMHIYNPLTVFDPIVLIHYTHMTYV